MRRKRHRPGDGEALSAPSELCRIDLLIGAAPGEVVEIDGDTIAGPVAIRPELELLLLAGAGALNRSLENERASNKGGRHLAKARSTSQVLLPAGRLGIGVGIDSVVAHMFIVRAGINLRL